MSKLYSYQNQLCTTILNKAKRYSFAPRPLLQSETKQKLTSFPSEHSSGENVLLFYALAERTNHSWRSDSGRFCPRIYTAIPITINPRTTAIGTVIGSWSDIDRNSDWFLERHRSEQQFVLGANYISLNFAIVCSYCVHSHCLL